MRPVEITRAAVANWSDTEQSSLGVAIKQASVACAARATTDFTGSALVDLSRLCALGFTWPATVAAANRYIHEDVTPKPRLAEAYALLINAELQLKDEHSALTDALALLTAVPYTSVVADATNQAIGYMHLLYTVDAVTLAAKRQPLLLAALHPASPDVQATPDAPPSTADLYKQALVLAELQQLQAEPAAAQETVAAIESALPSAIANDDLIAINRMRDRYALLGKPLPAIAPLASLATLPRAPKLPPHHTVTVLLLFPDWCAQCIRIAKQMPAGIFAVNQHDAYIYGLLAQTVPPQEMPKLSTKDTSAQKESFNPAYAAASLRGTPTFTVPPALLDTFNATDLPLLIVTDSHGIVRLFDIANESALQPGDTVDSAVALIGANWSSTPK